MIDPAAPDQRSHWHSSLDRPALAAGPLPPVADVVVVGGGVLGASAALWLARAGARPLVLDQAGPAAGASGRNGGLLVSGAAESYPDAVARLGPAAARAVYALSVEGFYTMRALVDEEGVDCELRLSGNLGLAIGEAQLARYAAAVELLRADGFAAELLDRAAAQALVEAPLGPEVAGAKFNPVAATLHSGRLVHGLLAAAIARGGALCVGPRALAFARDGAGVRVETDQGPVRAGAVVVAANAWLARIIPALEGVVTPVRGQALVSAPAPPLLTPGFGVALTPTGEYGQQRPDGRVVFGGCRAAAPGRDVGTYDLSPTPPVQAALDAGLARIFPSLAAIPVERRWAGTMAFTADYLPVAGQLDDLPVWYAGGFSGHGMPFAAPVGRALAEAALGAAAPPALALLRPDRPSLAG